MGGLGSLFEGKEQSRGGRPGWAVDRGFRKGLEKEPVPDLESDVVRELLSAAGADGEDPESQWRREDVGGSDGLRLTCTRSLIFWGSRFGPGRQTDGKGSSVVSFQPSARRRSRKSAMRLEDGNCIAVRGSPSEILRGRSIRNFVGGSTTMGASRLRRSGPLSGMSANRWFAGLVGNIRSYAITGVGHGLG